jgi:phenylacetate-CoA ligase
MTPDRTAASLSALQAFLTTSLDGKLGAPRGGAEQALALFHSSAREVPAYRRFLHSHGVDPSSIKTPADYRSLPLTTKQNYMRAYPLAQRCRGGDLAGCDMLAMSSGSTGTPMVWPRTVIHELDVAFRFEQIFHAFHADRRRTLAIVCFAMGNWVGGMFTAACCRHLAAKAYPITVATPGNKKEEILRVVRELGPDYDQVVLLGYPPYIKDVIDGGRAEGVAWPRYALKLVFAGEVFSEEWRDLVCERAGAQDPVTDTASLYGTADGGVLGNETPLSIRLRKYFAAHPERAREVFGESRLPTLVQYDPTSRWFEVHDGTLVVSGDGGVPLLRYHIADRGGVITYDEMMAIAGHAVESGGRGHWPLPFAYLFGRADFTVSFFGANVYPENISVGLEQPEVRDWVSGKFVLEVIETEDRNEALGITVELLPGIADDARRREAIAAAVLKELRRLNSEFAHYVPAEHQPPRITLKPNGDPEWFPIGVKHRYTRRSGRKKTRRHPLRCLRLPSFVAAGSSGVVTGNGPPLPIRSRCAGAHRVAQTSAFREPQAGGPWYGIHRRHR